MKSQLSSALTMVATHGVNVDHLARQDDAFRFVGSDVLNRQRDAGTDFAAQPADALVVRHPGRRPAIDLQDLVAGLEIGPIGGRADQRAGDLQWIAIAGNVDADAAELAFDACS